MIQTRFIVYVEFENYDQMDRHRIEELFDGMDCDIHRSTVPHQDWGWVNYDTDVESDAVAMEVKIMRNLKELGATVIVHGTPRKDQK